MHLSRRRSGRYELLNERVDVVLSLRQFGLVLGHEGRSVTVGLGKISDLGDGVVQFGEVEFSH
jgi:hypothetical protein